MRRTILFFLLFLLLLVTSCGQFKKLEQQKARANISLPKVKEVTDEAPKELVFSRPDEFIFVRQDGAEVPLNITAEWDSLYMENMSVMQTEEVLVVATDKRNVPERNGMISLDFVVSVPQELQHRNRLLYIHPIIERNDIRDSLSELRFTGENVRRLQQKEYADYQRYLDRIIPDTADFDQAFLKQKQYSSYLQRLNEQKKGLQRRWELLNERKESADPLFTRFDYFNKQSVARDSLLKATYNSRAEQKIEGMQRRYRQKEADSIVRANTYLLSRYSYFNERADRADELLKKQYAKRYTQTLAEWEKDSLRLVKRHAAAMAAATAVATAAATTAPATTTQKPIQSERSRFFRERAYKVRFFNADHDTLVLAQRRKAATRNTISLDSALKQWSVTHNPQRLKQENEEAYQKKRALLPMYQHSRELPDSFVVRKPKLKNNWRETLPTEVAGNYQKVYDRMHNLLPMYRYQRQIAGEGIYIQKYTRQQQQVEAQLAHIEAIDSVELVKNFYDTRKINLNQKRKAGKEDYFRRNVRFPFGTDCELDSVTVASGRVNYHYKKEVMADENSSRIKLFLGGQVVDPAGRQYRLPPSDTLTFLVSSMTYFLQKRVRYLQKTIYRDAEVNFSVNLDFPVGKSNYMDTLRNNKAEFKKIRSQILAMVTDPSYVIDSLLLTANCSPEGALANNERLARERAMTIKGLLQKELAAINDSIGISSSVWIDELGNQKILEGASEIPEVMKKIRVGWQAEDWGTLAELIRNTEQLKHKEQILNIIEKEPNLDRREHLIRTQYADDYTYMRSTLYPLMRSVAFSFRLHRRGMKEEKVLTNVPDTIYAEGLDWLEKRNYKKALELLRVYDDINTAVAYISLGYNDAAYRILQAEPESAHAKYMSAIVCSRLRKEKEAVIDLLRACELQPKLKFRANLDPELSLLIRKYGLFADDF